MTLLLLTNNVHSNENINPHENITELHCQVFVHTAVRKLSQSKIKSIHSISRNYDLDTINAYGCNAIVSLENNNVIELVFDHNKNNQIINIHSIDNLN